MNMQAYGVNELSAEEMQGISGGRSIWYYVGYAIAAVECALAEAGKWLP